MISFGLVVKPRSIQGGEVPRHFKAGSRAFIREHYEDFLAFDDVKIYYDNGQVEVGKILSSVFNALLPNPVFRKVIQPLIRRRAFRIFLIDTLLQVMQAFIDIPVKPVPINPRNGSFRS